MSTSAPKILSDNSSDLRRVNLDAFLARFNLQEITREELDVALTHRSYAYENGLKIDNERLEFLGDAILGAVAAEFLFQSDPTASEGEMSKRRARLVSRLMLEQIAKGLGLGELILLGRSEREATMTRRRSTLGSAFEAVVGVVYLKLGYDGAREFLLATMLTAAENDGASAVSGEIAGQNSAANSAHNLMEDYKSRLQEWSQHRDKTVPVYTRLSDEGPDHAKHFRVEVSVGGVALAQGEGSRVRQAQNDAARQALERVAREGTAWNNAIAAHTDKKIKANPTK